MVGELKTPPTLIKGKEMKQKKNNTKTTKGNKKSTRGNCKNV